MFTFVNMVLPPHISDWYSQHFEARLKGRYICQKHLIPIIEEYQNLGLVKVIGYSEKGKKIYQIRIGNGPEKVFAWSQMHGNESTTTKAIFDFLRFVTQNSLFKNEINDFKERFSFYIIPVLNPDGAALYMRENANGIDLNRDAANLTQAESKILRDAFETNKPDMCLNLHDQRTIYSLPNDKSATISFLAPAADEERSITATRAESMLAIASINQLLQKLIPGQIGRYDDSYNPNCVGDTFQSLGVPTILFEAGHYTEDYNREITRKYLFYSFLVLFNFFRSKPTEAISLDDYFAIPENEKNLRDVIIRNVCLQNRIVDIVIQFQEKLVDDYVKFIPVVEEITSNSVKKGHKEIDLAKNEILINSHENVFVNEEIATILYKKSKKPIFF